MNNQQNTASTKEERFHSVSNQESAELGSDIAKGDNRYVLGRSGTGKSTYMSGVIANNLSRMHIFDKPFTNIVVLDAGRSYERLCNVISDSQFINLTASSHSTLAPIELSGKKLTVFELEEIRYSQTDDIVSQIIDQLKKATNKESLVIIDEWWVINKAIKRWALTEFEGSTIVCAMTENDLTHDKSEHLFKHGMELKGISIKKLHSCI